MTDAPKTPEHNHLSEGIKEAFAEEVTNLMQEEGHSRLEAADMLLLELRYHAWLYAGPFGGLGCDDFDCEICS